VVGKVSPMAASTEFVRPDQATVVSELISAEYRESIRIPAGQPMVRRMYFNPQVDAPGPQGFLVEMPGPSINMAHFHEVDQFQLFFGNNGGWYKRHPLPALTVHYTDAYSTYGPFGSDTEETFRFFTLRPMRSGVAGYLPGARDLLMHRGRAAIRRRRNYSVEVALAGKPPAGESEQRTVMEREADGLAAHMISLGPGAIAVSTAKDFQSVGRYYCLVRGSLERDGSIFGVDSLGWVGSDAEFPSLVAGPAGCDLLALDFPAAWCPTSEPDE
jgi:hypothetical protein